MGKRFSEEDGLKFMRAVIRQRDKERKFSDEECLKLFIDADFLTDIQRKAAVRYIRLWLAIVGKKTIKEVDKCRFFEVEQLFLESLYDLQPRQFEVLVRRFGFDVQEEPKTLTETAKMMGISYSCARSLQDKAFKNLRRQSVFCKFQKIFDKTKYYECYEEMIVEKNQEISELRKKISEYEAIISKSEFKNVLVDISELGLSPRSYNALRRREIKTLEDLRNMTLEELANVSGLGKASQDEILFKLAEYGIFLQEN